MLWEMDESGPVATERVFQAKRERSSTSGPSGMVRQEQRDVGKAEQELGEGGRVAMVCDVSLQVRKTKAQ